MKKTGARWFGAGLGMAGGLGGVLASAGCAGGGCASCFGCVGGGVLVLAAAAFTRLKEKKRTGDAHGLAAGHH